MTQERNLQLFRFIDFVQSHWQPLAVKGAAAISGSLEDAISVGQWIEAASWLRFGVELGAYPVEESLALLNDSRFLMRSLVRRHREHLESVFSAQLFRAFEGFLNRGGSDYFSAQSPTATNTIPFFQAGQSLTVQMDRDRIATAFQQLLTFATEETWTHFTLDPISHSAIISILNSDDDPNEMSAELVIAGFIRTLDIMVLWNKLLENLRLDKSIEGGRSETVSRRMNQMNSWRLRLDEPITKKRFLSVAQLVRTCVVDFASDNGRRFLLDQRIFIEQVNLLVDDWLRQHPFEQYDALGV